MIDLKDLRANPDRYRRGCADKQMRVDIDELLRLDERLREVMTRREQLTAEKNRISKEIGSLAGRVKKAQGEEQQRLQAEMDRLQRRPQEIKDLEAELTPQVAQLEAQRDAIWLQVPQPADGDVPVGKGAEDNRELRRWRPEGFDPALSFESQRGFKPRGHLEIMQRLGLVDFDRGVKMAGSRSYVMTGAGMRLQQAVLAFAMNTMTGEFGFTPVSVPVLVRGEMMVGTGFFPAGKEQAYAVANPTGDYELYLTGTGEVGLMGLHQDEVLEPETLPLRYTTVSTCFRREAGAAGKDTAGLYRVHQFEKVEQVVICRADEAESRQWHARMIGYVETLLQRLGLPYRLLQCCTGDLGPKNADMIDIETWMPGRGELVDGVPTGAFSETHSASRLYDYQCRRLNLRYRDPVTRKPVVCHSLNNTVAACPRLLIPIVEMYQNADGTITVPEALRPLMGGMERIG